MDKKINELDAASDAEASNAGWLIALCDPTTGIAKKMTNAQHKVGTGIQKHNYVADGSEGTTLTIPALSGKTILLATRESGIIYEVEASPEASEYTWDSTSIELGAEVNEAGERFLFLYVK